MSADPSVPVPVPAPGSVDPVDVFELGPEHEQVVFCNDPATGLRAIVAIHSTALGPPSAAPASTPTPRPPTRSATSSTSPAACPTRRPSPGSTSAVARPSSSATRRRTRARRCCAPTAASSSRSAAATSPPATSAPSPPTWTSWRASARSSPAAPSPTAAPATRRCSRRTASTRACGPAPRRSGAHRASAAAPSAWPGSARSATTWSSTSSTRARRSSSPTSTSPPSTRWSRSTARSRGADTDALVRADLDVYAPCAMGGALTDAVVDVLTATIVCGAANNQLDHPGIEKALADRGILYAPDYCVNSGGLIQVADELEGFSFERAEQRASGIYETTKAVFELAQHRLDHARRGRRPARRAADARRRSAPRDVAAHSLRRPRWLIEGSQHGRRTTTSDLSRSHL